MSRPLKAGPRPRRTLLVRAKPGSRTEALVILNGRVERAAIGRSGIGATKREGDGATPLAAMRLLCGYYRGDRTPRPQTALPMRPIRAGMLWCDAPRHGAYNRPVTAPFAPSHERLMRDDALYDICLVMDWNITSRKRDGGSAIFFHIARDGYRPTEGCIAVSLPAMKRLIRAMARGTLVRVTR
ncbi:L,D-transpeptidase family protein [Ensifer soli]|uniref:L,D-transpeptidase family protein n=1 Tax=Ciceribacter sp. sgz301302 TaxID=3342379 RepID=UPI0035B9941D